MRAAEETTADLDSMPDDSALAVFTNGRNSLDRTSEAIERMPCAGSYQLKTLVIVITTNFACCHIDLLHIALKTPASRSRRRCRYHRRGVDRSFGKPRFHLLRHNAARQPRKLIPSQPYQ